MISEIEVLRQSDNGIQTLGDMMVFDSEKNHLLKCDTLELPDKGNKNKISCIPRGVYSWVKVGASTSIPYEHISILNVPSRAGICIHCGNTYKQILGCIIIGDNEIDIDKDGQKDVTNSKNTFDKLMKCLPKSGTILIH